MLNNQNVISAIILCLSSFFTTLDAAHGNKAPLSLARTSPSHDLSIVSCGFKKHTGHQSCERCHKVKCRNCNHWYKTRDAVSIPLVAAIKTKGVMPAQCTKCWLWQDLRRGGSLDGFKIAITDLNPLNLGAFRMFLRSLDRDCFIVAVEQPFDLANPLSQSSLLEQFLFTIVKEFPQLIFILNGYEHGKHYNFSFYSFFTPNDHDGIYDYQLNHHQHLQLTKVTNQYRQETLAKAAVVSGDDQTASSCQRSLSSSPLIDSETN